MTDKLYPTLTLRRDESPVSFAQRLADLHGHESFFHFCTDMGLSYDSIREGDEDNVRRLARLAGVEEEILLWNAIDQKEDAYRFRSEKLTRSVFRREHARYCPQCSAGDFRETSANLQEIAYASVLWTIVPIKTCHYHNLALVERLSPQRGEEERTVHRVAPAVRLDVVGTLPRIEQVPTEFERYLLNRLENGPGRDFWIDTLDFTAAVKLCEMVGAIMLKGRKVATKAFSESEWRDAGQIGFHRLTTSGFRQWLSDMQQNFDNPADSKNYNHAAIFGQFYQWIAFSVEKDIFDPVRQVMREHIIETMPVGPKDELFGKPIERRVLHSIRSASLEYQVHAKRLRKILAVKGLLPSDHESTFDNVLLFSADKADDLFKAGYFHALSLKEVSAELGIQLVQARLLTEAGFINPAFSVADPGLGTWGYLRSEIDTFMGKLESHAVPVDKPSETQLSIPKAAKKAKCGSAEILNLILENKLDWIGKANCPERYLSILVDLDEIKIKTRAPELKGLTRSDVIKDMGTSGEVVAALINTGIFNPVVRMHPGSRTSVEVVLFDEYRKFRETYVTLFGLAQEWKIHHATLATFLKRMNVAPAFDLTQFPCLLYRRVDIETCTRSMSNINGLTRSDVMRDLQCRKDVLRVLINGGLLRPVYGLQSESRVPVEIIPIEDYQIFKKTFAMLPEIARRMGEPRLKAAAILQKKGIAPVYDRNEFGYLLFRRADLEGLWN